MDKNLHNEIDELFSNGLTGLQEKPPANVWDAIESGLDKRDLADARSKNRRLRRLSLLLLLLLTSAVLFIYIEKQGGKKGSAEQPVAGNRQNEPVTNTGDKTAANTPFNTPAGNNNNTDQNNTPSAEEANKTTPEKSAPGETRSAENTRPANAVSDNSRHITTLPVKETPVAHTTTPLNTNNKPAVAVPGNNNNQQAIAITGNNPVKKKKTTSGKPDENKPGDLQNLVAGGNKKPVAEHPAQNQKQADNVTSATTAVTTADMPVKSLASPLVTTPALHDITYNPFSNIIKATPSVTAQLPRVSKAKKTGLSLSISPYYTYRHFVSDVREGRKEHHEDDREEIMQREEHSGNNTAGTIGLLASVQVNKKITVQSGLGIYTISNNISNQQMYAREHNRDGRQEEDFKFNCTAGTVYFNSKLINTNPAAGDSLQTLASGSKLQYLEIPVNIQYNLFAKGKLRLFASAGLTSNVLTKSTVNATITDGNLKEDVSSTTIDGLKKVYFSSGLGLGAEYQLTKSASIYVMPSSSFALSSINRNAPVNTSLNAVNVQAGFRINIGKR